MEQMDVILMPEVFEGPNLSAGRNGFHEDQLPRFRRHPTFESTKNVKEKSGKNENVIPRFENGRWDEDLRSDHVSTH